jgi:hypothetical protein
MTRKRIYPSEGHSEILSRRHENPFHGSLLLLPTGRDQESFSSTDCGGEKGGATGIEQAGDSARSSSDLHRSGLPPIRLGCRSQFSIHGQICLGKLVFVTESEQRNS